jgi:23S rRNA (guanosine2251-2'-O)-methyltransferase
MKMKRLVLVLNNIRSAHNVGSIMRTAEGLGVFEIRLTGYTPYPETKNDSRLPHLQHKQSLRIHKTALGAENVIKWKYQESFDVCLTELKNKGFLLVALEQTDNAIPIDEFVSKSDIAIVLGNEISGIEPEALDKIATHIQIPMNGHKESFNVAVAAAIAAYHLLYVK